MCWTVFGYLDGKSRGSGNNMSHLSSPTPTLALRHHVCYYGGNVVCILPPSTVMEKTRLSRNNYSNLFEDVRYGYRQTGVQEWGVSVGNRYLGILFYGRSQRSVCLSFIVLSIFYRPYSAFSHSLYAFSSYKNYLFT